jgi:hypothetical protein
LNAIYVLLAGTNATNWWDNGNNMVSWCRGELGFFVVNGEAVDLDESLMVIFNLFCLLL